MAFAFVSTTVNEIFSIPTASAHNKTFSSSALPIPCPQYSFEFKRGSQITEQNTYDFAIAYYHTLGFMDDNELQIHFSNIYKAIKAGGKFLLRTAGPQIIPTIIQEKKRDWAEKNKGRFRLMRLLIY